MSARGANVVRAALVAAVAVAIDQVTKAIVRNEIEPGETVDFAAGIDLVRVTNDGIAFGMLDDAGPIVIVIAGVTFAILLGVFLASAERRGLWLPIGLLAGGAIGNLIDRIRDGAVTDFIDPPRWPAFNVADIEITVGVLLLVGMYMFGEDDTSSEVSRSSATGREPAA